MPIYSRTGDTGSTSLFGGKRVLKCEELVDVYGSIDELNSWIGMITSQVEDADMKHFLCVIQSDLFIIGSQLAGWDTDVSGLLNRVTDMESRIDTFESKLPVLQNFILPGGTTFAAEIHLARAVCRRVERQTVALGQKQHIDSHVFVYMNRLSDYLFMLARYINNVAGIPEIVWRGIDRKEKKK